jgi:hypothetical protein
VEREKALSLPNGFESAHLSFSHPSGLMRTLGAIVGIWLGIVGIVKLGGKESFWFVMVAFPGVAAGRGHGPPDRKDRDRKSR